jgi:hypothetical protein
MPISTATGPAPQTVMMNFYGPQHDHTGQLDVVFVRDGFDGHLSIAIPEHGLQKLCAKPIGFQQTDIGAIKHEPEVNDHWIAWVKAVQEIQTDPHGALQRLLQQQLTTAQDKGLELDEAWLKKRLAAKIEQLRELQVQHILTAQAQSNALLSGIQLAPGKRFTAAITLFTRHPLDGPAPLVHVIQRDHGKDGRIRGGSTLVIRP